MIKLNKSEVSPKITSISKAGSNLKSSTSKVTLSKTNLDPFTEYVTMFDTLQSALGNYESIISQDTLAMESVVNEIVKNDKEIANKINNGGAE